MRKLEQIRWLARRLSRVSPGEIPHRAVGVCRAMLQRAGMLDARRVAPPVVPATRGGPWVHVPGGIDATAILREADALVAGRLSIWGRPVKTVNGIPQWNVDPASGLTLPQTFGLFIDFRHLGDGLDIKFLWELNRHLWWVPVAQAYAISGDAKYLAHLGACIDSWLAQCPYPSGANWSSPVEHGIRLINWSLVWHLIGGERSALFEGDAGRLRQRRWLESIYQHMHFARSNYSFHSSADNHLIGEAAGIYVGAQTWPCWPECARWRDEAKAILESETLRQFSADGVNQEQAMCYQKFSLEFLVAAMLVARASADVFAEAFRSRVENSIVFVAAMLASDRSVPLFGDSDDGRVFSLDPDPARSPYVNMVALGALLFDRADLRDKAGTLPAAVAWLDPHAARRWATLAGATIPMLPRNFVEGGYVLLGSDLGCPEEVRLLMDVGPLGLNRVAGHGHADVLSLTLSMAGRPVLVDAGTYCYNTGAQWRRYFRGTRAHNTAMVDGLDQSEYGGSFLWLRDVNASVTVLELTDTTDRVVATHDGYTRLADPVVHERSVTYDKGAREIAVVDRFACEAAHEIAVHWHVDPGCVVEQDGAGLLIRRDADVVRMVFDCAPEYVTLSRGVEDPPCGWLSRKFYDKEPLTTVSVRLRVSPGGSVRTGIRMEPVMASGDVPGRAPVIERSEG